MLRCPSISGVINILYSGEGGLGSKSSLVHDGQLPLPLVTAVTTATRSRGGRTHTPPHSSRPKRETGRKSDQTTTSSNGGKTQVTLRQVGRVDFKFSNFQKAPGLQKVPLSFLPTGLQQSDRTESCRTRSYKPHQEKLIDLRQK